MDVMFFGPPGAGKGTQAKILEEKRRIRPISTGDLLRKHRAEGTDYGKIAQHYLDSGNLVPDDVVIGIVKHEMRDAGPVLFDGFPRTRAQAEALTQLLRELGRGVPAVIVFSIDRARVTERLLARNRADDQPETIKNRLDVYDRETEPLIEYYRNLVGGNVLEVSADRSVEEVARQIDNWLESARQVKR